MEVSDLPDNVVLGTWSTAAKGDEYTAIVRLAFESGIRITPESAKQDIERRLCAHMLLPVDRKPTKADLSHAQMVWLADHPILYPTPLNTDAISQESLPSL